MQQRRLGPGDVLDDYCPRERRITDHAIVAMIDDNIKQTRCVVCDAEHEYKGGKVPAQRRKKAGAGLFGQVLEGLQPARLSAHADSADVAVMDADSIDAPDDDLDDLEPDADVAAPMVADDEPATAAPVPTAAPVTLAALSDDDLEEQPIRDDGPVRRPLIRATLPRSDGQAPPTRAMPEFTIRQPNNTRGSNRHGGRRRGSGGSGGHQGHGVSGPPRFGRGPGGGGARPHGARNQGPPSGRPRRGGKKR